MFTFSTDLRTAKEQIITYAKQLHSVTEKPPVNERNQQVEELVDGYMLAVGERPNERTLSYLADYILVDILAEQHKTDKTILSKKQMERQAKRQDEYDDGVIR